MTGWSDDGLLAFLEGRMDDAEREALLDDLDADPELSARLRAAAAGLEMVAGLGEPNAARHAPRPTPARVPRWYVAAAAAAALLVALPTGWLLARAGAPAPEDPAAVASGMPDAAEPTFVLVLHGRWPDAGAVSVEEAAARAEEYWAWTSDLAESGLLVAAGDLRWEPGERLGPSGTTIQVSARELEDPDYVVGMFALRADSYAEARSIARQCPHLDYGGRVSVRRVGQGFVTVPGMGDWTE